MIQYVGGDARDSPEESFHILGETYDTGVTFSVPSPFALVFPCVPFHPLNLNGCGSVTDSAYHPQPTYLRASPSCSVCNQQLVYHITHLQAIFIPKISTDSLIHYITPVQQEQEGNAFALPLVDTVLRVAYQTSHSHIQCPLAFGPTSQVSLSRSYHSVSDQQRTLSY